MRYTVELYTQASVTVVIDAPDEETAAREARELLHAAQPGPAWGRHGTHRFTVDIENGDWRVSEIYPEA